MCYTFWRVDTGAVDRDREGTASRLSAEIPFSSNLREPGNGLGTSLQTMIAKPILPRTGLRAGRRLVVSVLALLLGTGCCIRPADRAVETPGSVTGEMILEGGPYPHDGPRPITGTVRFLSGGRLVVALQVGKSGKFQTTLPPGTYRVDACTPQVQSVSAKGHRDDCLRPTSARVRSGATTTVKLFVTVP
jgi:hypothetical protein